MPTRSANGTLTFTTTNEAIADGYTVALQFSSDLDNWTSATTSTNGVRITSTHTLPNGDVETGFQIDAPTGENRVFWRIIAF